MGLKEHNTKSSALRIQESSLAEPSTVGSSIRVANEGSRLSSGSALLVTGKDQFSQHLIGTKQQQQTMGLSLLGVEGALPTIPSALSISLVVLGQFRRKEKPHEEDSRLPPDKACRDRSDYNVCSTSQ